MNHRENMKYSASQFATGKKTASQQQPPPPCRSYTKDGHCRFGDRCRYSHAVCKHFARGTCSYGDRCRFYHPKSQKQIKSPPTPIETGFNATKRSSEFPSLGKKRKLEEHSLEITAQQETWKVKVESMPEQCEKKQPCLQIHRPGYVTIWRHFGPPHRCVKDMPIPHLWCPLCFMVAPTVQP